MQAVTSQAEIELDFRSNVPERNIACTGSLAVYRKTCKVTDRANVFKWVPQDGPIRHSSKIIAR